MSHFAITKYVICSYNFPYKVISSYYYVIPTLAVLGILLIDMNTIFVASIKMFIRSNRLF